jgi:predicted DNA binding protein
VRQQLALDICSECLRHGPVEGFGSIESADVRALTDRQRTALQLAVTEGYYEWPREVGATELAAMMDIAQPTFSRHLRTAERKLFAVLVENVPGGR